MTSDPRARASAFVAALHRGSRSAVNEAGRALIAARDPLGSQWRAVAQALLYNGEIDLALAAIDCWTATASDDPTARFERVALLARAGRLAEARSALDALPAGVPGPAERAYLAATLALNHGDLDAAAATLATVVRAAPQIGEAWLSLVTTRPLAPDEAAAMSLAAASFAGRRDRGAAAFAHARARHAERQGDAAGVEAALAHAAAIMTGIEPFDLVADARAVADVLSWRAADLSALRLADAPPARPLFVTGLPRSGTTLVEQMLASHSIVAGGEELGFVNILARDSDGIDRASLTRFAVRHGSLQPLRALYDHLLAQRHPGHGGIVDKSLLGSRWLALIATVFPDARPIWLARDRRDNGWSLYRQFFTSGNGWTWSLEAIGTMVARDEVLRAHWQSLLGERLLVVPYEALVADSAAWIDRMTRHVGLMPEPAQHRFHETRRPVVTASAVQVRQPVTAAGVGHAARHPGPMAIFDRAWRAERKRLGNPVS